MTPIEAALGSWQIPPWPTVALLLTALVYWRGWRLLREQMPERFGAGRLVAFLGGLTAIWAALASPLDAFASLLLQVHMVQHILLTMVGPPLLWIGAPATPLLRGLPPNVARDGLGPFLAWPALRNAARQLSHPVAAGVAFALALAIWHLPDPYELALRSPAWHQVEHVTFLGTALLFWFPVVQPWPSRPVWPRWTMIPYLLLADLVNTVLAAVLTFSERVIYPAYAVAPRLWGLSALGDQAGAGALMWVFGSVAFLVPAGLIVRELLESGTASSAAAERVRRRRSGALQVLRDPPEAAHRFDLFRVPILGAFLRWRHGRRLVQAAMLLLAAAVIADGLFGPQMAPMNLAGVLPWTYWRGAVVVALLAAGNLFCFACPFMLPRQAAKRFFAATRVWPRWLRGKWLAVALLLAYLWAYEAFDLWDRPWWTASIALSYFAAAFAVDALFRGASFCKYVCPIGQFHFVHAQASPLELRVRSPQRCGSCTTHDCLRGRPGQRGCELDLFLPEKRGNLDCTLCLDCVHACPHDNIGLMRSTAVRDLAADPHRSSLRRLSERADVAALALVCVFGAFVNAAGMLSPVLAGERLLTQKLGIASLWVTSGGFGLALIVAPLAAVLLAADLGGRLGGVPRRRLRLAARFAPALVPLGLSMWAAHFLFHLLSGAGSLWPVVQRVAADLGSAALGAPDWGAAMAPAGSAAGLTALALLLLDGGVLMSLYAAWRVALAESGGRRAFGLFAPWAGLAVALYVIGAWIVFQPMEMRGMVH